MHLKLVIISPYQFRLKRGIERFTWSIANGLARRGISVTVYTWAASAETASWGEWHPNVHVRKVPHSRYFQSFIAGLFYNHWLKKDQPEIIALNFLYHGEHRLPRNKKYLYILNSPASETPKRYAFIQKQINRLDKIWFVAVSEMVKREALPYLRNKPVSVIYNGVDTAVFVPAPKDAGVPHKKIKLVTVAALEKRKGIQHMLTLLGKTDKTTQQKIQYDIYGEGAYRGELVALIRQYSLQDCVKIMEPVNNLHELLPGYDLFCLMSHGEAMPMAPLEAIACGLPVLCADVPPFDEFMSPEIGLAVNPANREQIIHFILGLRNTTRAHSYAAAARRRSLQFSWEIAADKYTSLLTTFRSS